MGQLLLAVLEQAQLNHGDVIYHVYSDGSIYKYMARLTQRRNDGGYLVVNIGGAPRPAHRIVFSAFNRDVPLQGMVIDHINGRRSDNRLSNLRAVSNTENMRNQVNGRNGGNMPTAAANDLIAKLALAGCNIRDMVEVTGYPGPYCRIVASRLVPSWRP